MRVTVRQQKNLPASREWQAYFFSEPSPNSVVLALEWERWLAENGLTPQQACLRYIFSLPEVARAVVGFDNVAQLRQIISSCTGALECLPNWPEHIDPNLLNPACWNQK